MSLRFSSMHFAVVCRRFQLRKAHLGGFYLSVQLAREYGLLTDTKQVFHTSSGMPRHNSIFLNIWIR